MQADTVARDGATDSAVAWLWAWPLYLHLLCGVFAVTFASLLSRQQLRAMGGDQGIRPVSQLLHTILADAHTLARCTASGAAPGDDRDGTARTPRVQHCRPHSQAAWPRDAATTRPLHAAMPVSARARVWLTCVARYPTLLWAPVAVGATPWPPPSGACDGIPRTPTAADTKWTKPEGTECALNHSRTRLGLAAAERMGGWLDVVALAGLAAAVAPIVVTSMAAVGTALSGIPAARALLWWPGWCRVCLCAAWLCCLSLTTVLGDFMCFPWDMLLLEAGAVAAMVPAQAGWAADSDALVVMRACGWCHQWLLFRVMVGMGWTKFGPLLVQTAHAVKRVAAGGHAAAADTGQRPLHTLGASRGCQWVRRWHGHLTYLRWFLSWQPLPSPLAWFAHHALGAGSTPAPSTWTTGPGAAVDERGGGGCSDSATAAAETPASTAAASAARAEAAAVASARHRPSRLSVGDWVSATLLLAMFVVELMAPFALLSAPPLPFLPADSCVDVEGGAPAVGVSSTGVTVRAASAASLVLLQAGIWATGNYGTFNALTAALVLPAAVPPTAPGCDSSGPAWVGAAGALYVCLAWLYLCAGLTYLPYSSFTTNAWLFTPATASAEASTASTSHARRSNSARSVPTDADGAVTVSHSSGGWRHAVSLSQLWRLWCDLLRLAAPYHLVHAYGVFGAASPRGPDRGLRSTLVVQGAFTRAALRLKAASHAGAGCEDWIRSDGGDASDTGDGDELWLDIRPHYFPVAPAAQPPPSQGPALQPPFGAPARGSRLLWFAPHQPRLDHMLFYEGTAQRTCLYNLLCPYLWASPATDTPATHLPGVAPASRSRGSTAAAADVPGPGPEWCARLLRRLLQGSPSVLQQFAVGLPGDARPGGSRNAETVSVAEATSVVVPLAHAGSGSAGALVPVAVRVVRRPLTFTSPSEWHRTYSALYAATSGVTAAANRAPRASMLRYACSGRGMLRRGFDNHSLADVTAAAARQASGIDGDGSGGSSTGSRWARLVARMSRGGRPEADVPYYGEMRLSFDADGVGGDGSEEWPLPTPAQWNSRHAEWRRRFGIRGGVGHGAAVPVSAGAEPGTARPAVDCNVGDDSGLQGGDGDGGSDGSDGVIELDIRASVSSPHTLPATLTHRGGSGGTASTSDACALRCRQHHQ